jgi:hypothetical protein
MQWWWRGASQARSTFSGLPRRSLAEKSREDGVSPHARSHHLSPIEDLQARRRVGCCYKAKVTYRKGKFSLPFSVGSSPRVVSRRWRSSQSHLVSSRPLVAGYGGTAGSVSLVPAARSGRSVFVFSRYRAYCCGFVTSTVRSTIMLYLALMHCIMR